MPSFKSCLARLVLAAVVTVAFVMSIKAFLYTRMINQRFGKPRHSFQTGLCQWKGETMPCRDMPKEAFVTTRRTDQRETEQVMNSKEAPKKDLANSGNSQIELQSSFCCRRTKISNTFIYLDQNYDVSRWCYYFYSFETNCDTW